MKRPLWIVENFFTYDSRQFHEISLYYEVNLLTLPVKGADSFLFEEEGRKYKFQWIPLEQICEYNVKPEFLKDKMTQLPLHVEHIVKNQ